MKIKASVDYGVRTVLYLAVKGGICSSREISEEMTIPRDYLIQLALHLRKAGLIKTRPGKNGGYELAKSPDEITIGEIMNVFESDLKGSKATKRRRKMSESASAVYAIQGQVMKSLDSYMHAISVRDLMTAVEDEDAPTLLLADALESEARHLREEAAAKLSA